MNDPEGDKFVGRTETTAANSAEPASSPPRPGAATVNADNPWPGLLAFREADQQFFTGRLTETDDLFRLVMRERLTVLFGLSGLGKTSLLQAGLFPLLRPANIFPIYIRLDFSAADPDLIAQVKSAIARQSELTDIEAPALDPHETLWEYFHRRDSDFWNSRNRPVMPLIVFDQFEEVFTLGRLDAQLTQATATLLEQLGDLAEGRAPAALKALLEKHPENTKNFSFSRHNCKLLLSIREDFLPELEGLRERIPSIALNRLRLQRMNGSAALSVVSQGGHLIDSQVGEEIVRFVAAGRSGAPLDSLEVEPALLSVVCCELNDKRQTLNEPKISESLLEGSHDQILTDFYESTVGDMPVEVRSFIEDRLLTVSGFRDSVAVENALSLPCVTPECINQLVERRLLRREDRGGVQRLELTHDLLTGVVRASRIRRRQQEEAEKARLALLQQKRLAAEREVARKRKLRQTQWVAGAMALLAAVSLVLAFVAIREKNRAETNLRLAKKAVDESLSSAGRQQAQGTADLPEMVEFRQGLLDKAASFYADFTRQAPKSQELRSEVAAAHSRLGDIHYLQEKHEVAVHEYTQAIAQFEGLIRDYPDNREYRQALAYAHNFLGETLRTWCEELQGATPCDLSAAEEQYDKASALQQRLLEQDSANPTYQQELARTYYNRGIFRYDARNVAGAESDFRAAIGLLKRLADKPLSAATAGTTPQPSQELARAYNNLANITRRNNPPAALELYQQAIGLAEALNRKQPDNRQYQLELAQYYDNLAMVLFFLKQFDLAKEKNHQAVDLIEGLTNPGPLLSRKWANGVQFHYEILEAQKSRVADHSPDRLREILRQLNSIESSREHPVFHIIYMNLAKIYIEIAERNLKSGDVKGTVAALESLARILPELSVEDREVLAKSYPEFQREAQKDTATPVQTNY
jgi:tetratricopeptide (TPR) repeat protein